MAGQKVGRKSKGDRHAFMTRIPRDAADRLIAEAQRQGVSYSDLIAHYVSGAVGVHHVLSPDRRDAGQKELPLTG